jgi:hypothetical protein
MPTFDSQVSKREIIQTQIEHTRYSISPKEFKSWVTRISFALLLCTTEGRTTFERILPVVYLGNLIYKNVKNRNKNIYTLL